MSKLKALKAIKFIGSFSSATLIFVDPELIKYSVAFAAMLWYGVDLFWLDKNN